MACDRIGGILQSVFHTQEATRPPKYHTSNSGRIPSHDQEFDGEIESTVSQHAISSYIDISQQANDWGALSRKFFYLLPFVIFILLNRDHHRPPREGTIQPPSDCTGDRILRNRARFRALEGSVIFSLGSRQLTDQ